MAGLWRKQFETLARRTEGRLSSATRIRPPGPNWRPDLGSARLVPLRSCRFSDLDLRSGYTVRTRPLGRKHSCMTKGFFALWVLEREHSGSGKKKLGPEFLRTDMLIRLFRRSTRCRRYIRLRPGRNTS